MPMGMNQQISEEELQGLMEFLEGLSDQDLEELAKIGEEAMKEWEEKGFDPMSMFDPAALELLEAEQKAIEEHQAEQDEPEQVDEQPETITPSVSINAQIKIEMLLKSAIKHISNLQHKASIHDEIAAELIAMDSSLMLVNSYLRVLLDPRLIKELQGKESEPLHQLIEELATILNKYESAVEWAQPSTDEDDPYAILALQYNATQDEIKQQFESLKNKLSSQEITKDLKAKNYTQKAIDQEIKNAARSMRLYKEAYDTLSDPAEKAAVDQQLARNMAGYKLSSIAKDALTALAQKLETIFIENGLIEKLEQFFKSYEPKALAIRKEVEKIVKKAQQDLARISKHRGVSHSPGDLGNYDSNDYLGDRSHERESDYDGYPDYSDYGRYQDDSRDYPSRTKTDSPSEDEPKKQYSQAKDGDKVKQSENHDQITRAIELVNEQLKGIESYMSTYTKTNKSSMLQDVNGGKNIESIKTAFAEQLNIEGITYNASAVHHAISAQSDKNLKKQYQKRWNNILKKHSAIIDQLQQIEKALEVKVPPTKMPADKQNASQQLYQMIKSVTAVLVEKPRTESLEPLREPQTRRGPSTEPMSVPELINYIDSQMSEIDKIVKSTPAIKTEAELQNLVNLMLPNLVEINKAVNQLKINIKTDAERNAYKTQILAKHKDVINLLEEIANKIPPKSDPQNIKDGMIELINELKNLVPEKASKLFVKTSDMQAELTKLTPELSQISFDYYKDGNSHIIVEAVKDAVAQLKPGWFTTDTTTDEYKKAKAFIVSESSSKPSILLKTLKPIADILDTLDPSDAKIIGFSTDERTKLYIVNKKLSDNLGKVFKALEKISEKTVDEQKLIHSIQQNIFGQGGVSSFFWRWISKAKNIFS